MSKKDSGKYEMVGVPYAFGANLLVDRDVGDRFDADFSEEDERALVDAGAIRRTDASDEVVPQPDAIDLAPEPEGRPVEEQPAGVVVEDDHVVEEVPPMAVDSPVPGAREDADAA